MCLMAVKFSLYPRVKKLLSISFFGKKNLFSFLYYKNSFYVRDFYMYYVNAKEIVIICKYFSTMFFRGWTIIHMKEKQMSKVLLLPQNMV